MHDFLLRVCGRMTPSIRGLALVGVLALGALLNAGASLEAEPVTFAFEAEIASVIDRDGGAGVPFTVAVGDTLSTSFELDSFSDGPQYPQTGTLLFKIAGHEFSLTGFLATVTDNHVPDAVPFRGRIADPLNTPIVDQGPGVSDRLSLSCDSPFFLTCAALSSNEDIEFGTQIALFGDQTVVDSTELDTNLAVWNTFDFREMSLLFRDKSTGGTTRIGAYIGPLSIVPEPTSGCLLVSCIVLLVAAMLKNRVRKPVRFLF